MAHLHGADVSSALGLEAQHGVLGAVFLRREVFILR